MERETVEPNTRVAPPGSSLADLVDDIEAVVWEADPVSFDFIFVNRRGIELLGYERADWYQPGFWADRLVHPDDRAVTVAFCRKAVQERRDHRIEYRALTAHGHVVWLRDFIRVIVGEDGQVRALRGMMLDITAEKAVRAELDDERAQLIELAHEREETLDALRASESHYRRLVQTSPFGVFVIDAAGTIIEANVASAATVGLTPDEVVGSSITRWTLPEDLEHALTMVRAMLEDGEPREYEVRVRGVDRVVRTLAVAGTPIVEDGERVGIHGVVRDITDEIGRDQHLRRVERLASLGTLIGGVAHELNNPLTAVVGFAHLLLHDERPQEERETLETILREAERAARIVADLRMVARSTEEESARERQSVDLNELVRHVLSARRHALAARRIHVVEQLAEDLPVLSANRALLEQVVVNVLVNAEQALDRESGRKRVITVRTRALEHGVALHVADNGPGIRASHLNRIFDPFFTTKAPGEGTGLGLALAHSIVTGHGGSMRVESKPDQGAEFVIELPVNAPAAESRTRDHDSTRISG